MVPGQQACRRIARGAQFEKNAAASPPFGRVELCRVARGCDARKDAVDFPAVAVTRCLAGGPPDDDIRWQIDVVPIEVPAFHPQRGAENTRRIFIGLLHKHAGDARLPRFVGDAGCPEATGIVMPLPSVGKGEGRCRGDAERHGAEAPRREEQAGNRDAEENPGIRREIFGQRNAADGGKGEAGKGKAAG